MKIYKPLLLVFALAAVLAQDPPELFQHNSSSLQAFYFVVSADVNGVEISSNDWIGAFNGDTCVGAKQWIGPYTDIPVLGSDGTLESQGYMSNGGIPTFKIWIASANYYLDAVASQQIPWSNGNMPFVDSLHAETAGGEPDCMGVPGGIAFIDECGVCSGGTSGHLPESDMDCAGECFGNAVVDCNDDCDGTASVDACGICSGGNTGHAANSDQDCAGVCFGNAFEDNCDICSGGTTGHIANSDQDCAGTCFGNAYEDNCGTCDANPNNDCNEDCNGDEDGTAYIDSCGECVGGNTGQLEDWAMDCAGVCFGNAYFDDCGVCDANQFNDNACQGCTDPEAVNYNPDATEDDGSCEYGSGVPELFDFNQSSQQAFYFVIDAMVNGVTITTNDWIGSFNGDVCVGAKQWIGPYTDVPVLGYDGTEGTQGYMTNGGYPTFKIYITALGAYFDAEASDQHPWSNNNLPFISTLTAVTSGEDDCMGVPGGFAFIDGCGICSGGTSGHQPNSDQDCAGVCFGSAQEDCAGQCNGAAFDDDCGVCSGGTSGHIANSDQDCAGTCFGSAEEDCTGLCDGSAFLDNCDVCSGGTSGHAPNSDQDCAGVCFGNAIENECGCVGGTTGNAPDFCYGCTDPEAENYDPSATIDDDSCTYSNIEGCTDPDACNYNPDANIEDNSCLALDCNNECGGTASLDDCSVCTGGTTGLEPNADKDCTGECFGNAVLDCDDVCGGEAFLDDCEICSGGTTGHVANSNIDCNDECFGNAELDDCDVCSGGTTGLEPNADKDCAGECFGNAVLDCDDVCGGEAFLDDCEICSGGTTGHVANSNIDCNDECFGNAELDDCEVCSGGTTGLEPNADKDCAGECFGNAVLDCDDVCGGEAFLDDCEICSGGTTGHVANSNIDCNDECFGNAELDDCEVCSGGTTGLEPNADKDCAGECFGNAVLDCDDVCGGEAFLDDCDICSGGTSLHVPNSNIDCNDECFGNAELDDCEVCSGGTTGLEPNADKDCAGECFGNAILDCDGVCGGEAFLDDCDICSGGTSLHVPNSNMDCAGECFGDAELDCADVCDGNSTEDDCGVCDDNPDNDNECYGCMDPEALNFDPDATIDDDSCDYGEPELFQANQSMMQAFYFFEAAELDNVSLEVGDWIGAFNGPLCVGAAQWSGEFTEVPVYGDDGGELTDGYMTTGVIPSFMIWDAGTDSYFDADASEEIPWTNFGTPFITLLSAFTAPLDCAGTPGGTAFYDDCEVCSGGTSGHEANSDKDCNDECFGNAFLDDCAECVGGTTGQLENWAKDCADVCFGSADLDDCEVCSGGTSGHEANSDKDCNDECFGNAFLDDCAECVGGTTGQLENWAKDCADVCFGTAFYDDCEVCSGGTSGHEANSDKDCNDECFGNAFLDDCAECVGGTTGQLENWAKDCADVCFGSADYDDCEVCSGGTSGHEANSDKDCNDECFGNAFLDDCAECVGGTTGQLENWAKDCADVCFGSADYDDCEVCSGGTTGHEANSDKDCNDECFGVAEEDLCGVCDEDPDNDNTTCLGCTDPNAVNYDPEAIIDDDSCEYAFAPEEFSFNQSLLQAFYYFATAELDGIELDHSDWIGAFNGDICVGSTNWRGDYTDVPVYGIDGSEDTEGYMSNGLIPTWKIYDYETDSYFDALASEDVPWGNLAMPIIDLLSASNIYFDCTGTENGQAFIDDCGICSGGTSGHTGNSDMDCNDECFGTADLDDCDICSGGTTGHEANSDMDCNDECFGNAFLDDCSECVGGTTGQFENWALDCNGECFGGAYIDDCNICDANPDNDNECMGCTNPEANNYNPDATVDDGSCNYQETTLYELHAGNNLVGFAGIPDDPSAAAILNPIAESVVSVLGEGSSAIPHPVIPGAWLGNLTEFEATGGYWFIMESEAEFEVTAYANEPGIVHNLHAGNNLTSFTGVNGTAVADALPDEVEPLIDKIIGEGVSAIHHPLYPDVWIGNLTHFYNTDGYWFRMIGDADMVYQSDGLSRFIQHTIIAPPADFSVTQSTEQSFYYFEEITIDGYPASNSDWILAYNNDVLVGISQVKDEFSSVAVMGSTNSLETAGYLSDYDVPTFKLYREGTGEMIKLQCSNIPSFENNEVFIIAEASGEIIVSDFNMQPAYPNPFNPVTSVSFNLPEDSHVNAVVFDINGRLVEELVNEYRNQGTYKITWSAGDYSSGVYFLKLRTENMVSSQKLLLVK